MRIYVGKLPYTMDDNELNDLFAQYGQVESAKVMMDNDYQPQPRSKGFGFVEMPAQEEAEAAITALNGYQAGRMQLVVNEARPREERPKYNDRQSGGNGSFNRNGGDSFTAPSNNGDTFNN